MNRVLDGGHPSGFIKIQLSKIFGTVEDHNYQGKDGEAWLLSVYPLQSHTM
jgi:hypothetical protein